MNQSRLFISAVIPAYNAADYIGRTIASVLEQTRPADEILVVDDGSSDDTADVVGSFGSRVRLVQQSNAGASAARNAGIRAAKGSWIAFLDGDDEWLPHHMQAVEDVLTRHPHLVWVTANYITCSCSEDRRAPSLVPSTIERFLGGRETVDYFEAALRGMGGHTDTMVIRRSALLEAGGFREDQKKANDLDMWWRIACRYPEIGYLAQPAAIYHLAVPHSITKKSSDARFYADLIDRHLTLARQSGCAASFEPVAVKYLRSWIRSMLFKAQTTDIRILLRQFARLLPKWYYGWMWVLTVFPKTTQAGCLLISAVVRALGLRRRVVLPPRNPGSQHEVGADCGRGKDVCRKSL